jgi:cell division ATPase FtsA
VRTLLASLEGAGLTPSRIDLGPFALIRALRDDGFSELAEGADGATAEAIVDIGGGLTNVVVHERGVPRFVRTLPIGGGEVTAAVAADLDVTIDVAELLKRRADDDAMVAADVEVRDARQVAEAAFAPVLEEIRGSLDYWQAQTFDEQLMRVVLVGGASRSHAVDERLSLLVGVPVDHGAALREIDTSDAGLTSGDLEAAQAIGSVAVGLALSGETLASGERRISLLPVEFLAHRRERRQIALAGAAVAAFAVLLLAVYLLRAGHVHDVQQAAARSEARGASLQQQISSLSDVESLQADIAARRQTVRTVLTGDIAWTRLIQQVATVMPNDAWISALNASRASATGPGQISFTAMGLDQTAPAHWLIRIGGLSALSGAWVPTSARATGALRELVGFTSNASLAPAAASDRAKTYAGDG